MPEPKPSHYQLEAKPLEFLASLSILTPSDILGPFYRPGAPWRQRICLIDLVNLVLSGRVLTAEGKPAEGYIEFWQADHAGAYDVTGPDYRGIQPIGKDGGYILKTVVPGCYDISEPGDPDPHQFRCPHIHVKVWIGGRDVLTTQLYFPKAEHNADDHWFDPQRVIKFDDPAHPTEAKFDIVIAV